MTTKRKPGHGRHKRKSPIERMTREERVALFWKLVSQPGGIHLQF